MLRRASEPFRAVLFTLAVSLLIGCSATLEEGLDESEANEALIALTEDGIGARKERARGQGSEAEYALIVAGDDVGSALASLRRRGLPRDRAPGLGEVFGEGGLVPTQTEERARLSVGVAGELSRTLNALPSVLDARVHIALPENRPLDLSDAPPRPTASVLLRHTAGQTVDEGGVKALVAGAVHGMTPADVSVVFAPIQARDVSASALSHIGPIAVTSGTANALRGVLAGALLLLLLMAGLLLFIGNKLRRTRAELAARPASSADAPPA